MRNTRNMKSIKNKAELKRDLTKLGINVVGNCVRKKDIERFFSVGDSSLLKNFKVAENDNWTTYKLPCAEDEVKGIPTYDVFHIMCEGTTWIKTDDFWEQLKAANMIIYFFISKSKPQTDPLWKIATDQREQTYLNAHDEQVHNVGELKLPALRVVAPKSQDGKCVCDLYEMMREGCKCGAMEHEKAQKQNQLNPPASATSSIKRWNQLTAELRKIGITTYIRKSSGEAFVKRSDVKNILANLLVKKTLHKLLKKA